MSPTQSVITSAIMIIEDDEPTRKLLRQFIELEGTPVIEAENGRVAIEYLRSNQEMPSALLLDLAMPNMNGAQFLELVRLEPRAAGIPVIVASAWNDVEARAARLGVQHYLRKPFDLERLRRALEQFLSPPV